MAENMLDKVLSNWIERLDIENKVEEIPIEEFDGFVHNIDIINNETTDSQLDIIKIESNE